MTRAIAAACALSMSLVAVARAQVPAGGEFRVNTYTTFDQSYPAIAMQPDGGFVVVWSGAGTAGSGINGQRYSPAGTPRGGEFRIDANTNPLAQQVVPRIATAGDGSFVVTWMKGYGSGSRTLRGRLIDAAGAGMGAEFQVESSTTGDRYYPAVDRAAGGRFVVVWGTRSGTSTGIAARRFDGAGNPVGGEFQVSTYTVGAQTVPAVAMDDAGRFIAVWASTGHPQDNTLGILAQRFDADGSRLGDQFLVNTYTTGPQFRPAISASPRGGFVVAWGGGATGAYGVSARRLDAQGSPLGDEFQVNSSPGFLFPRAAHDARGNFVVTWSAFDGSVAGVDGQRFSAAGARRGTEFRANSYTTNDQTRPDVASDATGNFVVTWRSTFQDGSSYGVFAQRFGGLYPSGLAVDSLGNGVLEPGETVDVGPRWRNENGAAVGFGGALGNMTGPPGALYITLDGTADYGTVANGTDGPCVDCYAVFVSDPPTRPAQHWDAAATETIVPDALGQQANWSLHVGRSFADVPASSPFYRFIETLLHGGVTGGCAATTYCPASPTSREQMAVFVLVAKDAALVPPACGATPMFADVPVSSPFCRWVEELARRGVVGGCGGGNYCPTQNATREQMAVFVLRTLDPALSPPPCGTPVFADVPASSPFCPWIEELARRGVVSGCGGGNYCPASAVSREQMSVFLGVTFGLTLYGP